MCCRCADLAAFLLLLRLLDSVSPLSSHAPMIGCMTSICSQWERYQKRFSRFAFSSLLCSLLKECNTKALQGDNSCSHCSHP
jgi:hypothetical protein